MQNVPDNNYELLEQARKIELCNSLNQVVSVLTNLSSQGSSISRDVGRVYELIYLLKQYWLGNRYSILVDIFNLKVQDINSDLRKITYLIPSYYERIVSQEAKNNGIIISNVNHSNFQRINYIRNFRTAEILFDENGILSIKDDADKFFNNALLSIDNINNLKSNDYNLNNDIKAASKNIENTVLTLKTNMDNKMDEAIVTLRNAERFAINTTPNFKIKLGQ